MLWVCTTRMKIQQVLRASKLSNRWSENSMYEWQSSHYCPMFEACNVICLLSVYLVRVEIMLEFLYFNSLVTWKSYAFILLPIYDKYWLRSNRNETIWIYIYHLFYINGWSTVLYNYLFILLSQLHSDTYSRNL